MSDERLQKILAECGIASRRRAEELIAAGKVKVNGRRAQVGDKADLKRDTVTVEGRHDPCIVPRAVAVVEAMTALVIADQMARDF